MSKRSRGFASKGEPTLKRDKRESEVEASMPKVVPLGIEEKGEEEEEEEEVPVLRSRGLRSRGPVISRRESSRINPSWLRRSSDLNLTFEIPGISTQPGPSLVHERRVEVQQPGSSSVLMPTSRVIDLSPTTGVLNGKVSIAETTCVEL